MVVLGEVVRFGIIDSLLKEFNALGSIILAGHSSGANICALALLDALCVEQRAQQSDRLPSLQVSGVTAPFSNVEAFIGLAGVYDIEKHFLFESARGVHEISPMAAAAGGPSGFALCSPTLLSRQIVLEKDVKLGLVSSVDCVLIHGTEDTTVPHTSSEEFAVELKALGFNTVTNYVKCDHGAPILDLMFLDTLSTEVTEAILKAWEERLTKKALIAELEEIEFNKAITFPTYSESWLGSNSGGALDANSDFVQKRRTDLQNFFASLFIQYPRLFGHPRVIELLQLTHFSPEAKGSSSLVYNTPESYYDMYNVGTTTGGLSTGSNRGNNNAVGGMSGYVITPSGSTSSNTISSGGVNKTETKRSTRSNNNKTTNNGGGVDPYAHPQMRSKQDEIYSLIAPSTASTSSTSGGMSIVSFINTTQQTTTPPRSQYGGSAASGSVATNDYAS
eukprot:gene22826-28999_t